MSWVQALFLSVSAILLFAAFAPRVPYRTWWTRSWVYGRLQLFWLSLLLLCAYLVAALPIDFTDWIILGAIAVASLIYAFELLPYTCLTQKQSPAATGGIGTDITILLVNVLQDNKDYQAVCDRIVSSDADIVFLCETDEAWRRGIHSASQRYPYQYELPLDDYNGLLFYSKFEICDVEERYLSRDYIPSLKVTLRLPTGQRVRVYAIHPRPPRPEDPVDYLDKEIADVACEADEDPLPSLIMGDLNEVGWSPLIRDIFKRHDLLDPRRGRGIINTYNAQWPIARWPLDHVFHTRSFQTVGLKRLEACGSDHFPMQFTLHLSSEVEGGLSGNSN